MSLEESGLWAIERLELIGGELISKRGRQRAHVIVLMFVQTWLASKFGFEYVNIAVPVDVAPDDNPANELEPDLIVLRRPSLEYPVAKSATRGRLTAG